MKSLAFFLASLLLAALGCRHQSRPGDTNTPSQSSDVTETPATSNQVPPGFMDFYEKFHADSLYQMAHIAWPLEGLESVAVDSTQRQLRKTFFKPENWLMQRTNFPPTDYLRQWQTIGDLIVIERIRARAANYGLERRFAKQSNGEWELIYYADMHELGE